MELHLRDVPCSGRNRRRGGEGVAGGGEVFGRGGCVNIHAYRAMRDERLHYIHSIWKDADAFELHAALPHTVRFLDRITELSNEERDVRRTERLD